jgi:hypothetical protein
MSTMTPNETLWVVVDGQEQIVLILGGRDAAAAAAEWAERGYRVEPLEAPVAAPEVRAD